MTVKERLILFIAHLGISKRKFCSYCGFSETFISSMKISTSEKKFEIIAQHYPELNIHWLRLGEGKMIKEVKEKMEMTNREDESVTDKLLRAEIEIKLLREQIMEVKADLKEEIEKNAELKFHLKNKPK
ncbi:MAG: hypothetical protein WCR20_14940 [Verrucomicrobiota bacterium]